MFHQTGRKKLTVLLSEALVSHSRKDLIALCEFAAMHCDSPDVKIQNVCDWIDREITGDDMASDAAKFNLLNQFARTNRVQDYLADDIDDLQHADEGFGVRVWLTSAALLLLIFCVLTAIMLVD